MARSVAILALAALMAASSSSAVPILQDALDAGWESRWTHSSDAKYTGRFTSSDKGGVQVREGEWLALLRDRGRGREKRQKELHHRF